MTSTRPLFAAVTGTLCLVPVVTANIIVGHRIEPFFSLIRPGLHSSTREYVLLGIVLLSILVGATVAARPMARRSANGSRHFYPVNAAVAVLLSLAFVVLSLGLGSDIYRCDVLGVPNCD
jgi:uncharacterized membrane protein YidH (DUF202 family)